MKAVLCCTLYNKLHWWQEGLPVAAVSRRLVREAVRERHCKDNCTAVVITFRKVQWKLSTLFWILLTCVPWSRWVDLFLHIYCSMYLLWWCSILDHDLKMPRKFVMCNLVHVGYCDVTVSYWHPIFFILSIVGFLSALDHKLFSSVNVCWLIFRTMFAVQLYLGMFCHKNHIIWFP